MEIIIWILTGIILSEVLFIFWTKWMKNCKDEYNTFYIKNFVLRKFTSLFLAGLFMYTQFTIVYIDLSSNDFSLLEYPRYELFIWEFLIIAGILLFFYINKKISDKILGKIK
jgi:hypothetical protein